MHLFKTFSLLTDESGLGYYRRLASENTLFGWKELARICEVSSAKTALFGRPEFIAEQLGLDRAWSELATARDELARGWRGLRRCSADAVCPECLRESPHLRISWEHVYMVACPHHQAVLCDSCDSCGQPLSQHREHIAFCSCGHDLRAMRPQVATQGQLWLAALVESAGASSGRWAPSVAGAPVDLVAMLVRTLCLFYDPMATPAKQNSAPPRSVKEAVEFLRPLEQLLADWPRNFEAHVSARIAAGRPEARTLNTLLGKWYHQLRALSECAPLQPFLEAVGRVASTEFDGVLGLDRAAAAITKDSTHLLLALAAARIGMHRDTLATYVKRGQMQFRAKKVGTTGTVYEVAVLELDEVVIARQNWVSESQACGLLGVPPSVLYRLVDAGLIRHESGWRTDLRKGGPVELASVHLLVGKMRALRLSPPAAGATLIALEKITARRAGDNKAVSAALAAIARGEILPAAAAPTIGGFQFCLADVAKHFSRPVLEAGLSVQALSKITGWKWESISHWMTLGLLESNSIVLRGQPCRVVMPQQLLEFCRSYVPLADLARQLGSKSSALADRLEDVEVLGSKSEGNGQQRGGLVRIEDMARIAFSKPARTS